MHWSGRMHHTGSRIRGAGDLLGADVVNPDNEQLGEIEELAIDTRTGKIRYVVLGTRMNDKNIAVPWKAFTHRGQDTLVLNAGREDLYHAQAIDETRLPMHVDFTWIRTPRWDRFDDRDRFGTWDETRSIPPQTQARRFANALRENSFALADAVRFAEGRHNCHALAAQCRLASFQPGVPDQPRRGDSDSAVLVDITCESSGDPNTMQLISLSPITGQIVEARNIPLER